MYYLYIIIMYNSQNEVNETVVNETLANDTLEINETLANDTLEINETTVNETLENNQNEEEKQQILDDVLSQLSEILKDNKMEQFAKMDMSNIERDMNNMVEELKKRNNDPNMMSMLNLFNNLSISNLTDSNFSLGDCDVSNLGKSNEFSDTSEEDEDDEEDEENYEENNNYNDNSSTDTDEDLLNYMKDREENEDMVLSIKQKLEEID